MRVTREGHGIGITAHQFCYRTIILPPRPRTVTGILQVRVLDVEERLFCFQFPGMLLHQLCQTGDIIGMPVGTYEVITLYCFEPDGGIILFETFLPHLCWTLSYALGLCGISPHTVNGTTPGIALHVVITIDEESLRMFSVQPLVIGEYTVPGVCHHLQLGFQPLVCHITCYDNTIHFQAAEVLKGMLKGNGCLCATDMDITDNANYQIGIAQGAKCLGKSRDIQVSCSG